MEITSLVGVRLDVKAKAETVNFDVKAKLEERERKSQMVVVGFSLSLSTKPSIVKFEIEGIATLTGKDAEINEMLEVDPETKVPYVFQRVYQHAFMAMYLLSTILDAPPPPYDLLFSKKQGASEEAVSVEMGETGVVGAEVAAEEESVSGK
ncbi:MAG: hypothetical protein QXK98_01675 [Candidatus Bathyarchaeia archaeon]